jgi:hypothetical protein
MADGSGTQRGSFPSDGGVSNASFAMNHFPQHRQARNLCRNFAANLSSSVGAAYIPMMSLRWSLIHEALGFYRDAAPDGAQQCWGNRHFLRLPSFILPRDDDQPVRCHPFFGAGQTHVPKIISIRRRRSQRLFCHFCFWGRAKTRPEGHFRPGVDLPTPHLVILQITTTSEALQWSCF